MELNERLDRAQRESAERSNRYHDQHRYETPETLFLKCGIGERERIALASPHSRETAPGWWGVHDSLMAGLGAGMFSAIVGAWGTGKTVLAAAVLREACNQRVREPKYSTAPRFFRELHAARGEDGEGEKAVVSRYSRSQLLVLDEADKRAGTDYEDRLLWEIIDNRYKRMLDTLLISNLSVAAFASTMGGAVMDRMRECGELIECDWPSFRSKSVAHAREGSA